LCTLISIYIYMFYICYNFMYLGLLYAYSECGAREGVLKTNKVMLPNVANVFDPVKNVQDEFGPAQKKR